MGINHAKQLSRILHKVFANPVSILREYAQSSSYVNTFSFEDASPSVETAMEYILGREPYRLQHNPQRAIPTQQRIYQFKDVFFISGRVFTKEGAYLHENVRIRYDSPIQELYIGDIDARLVGKELFAMAPKFPGGENIKVMHIQEPCMPFCHPGLGTAYGHLLLENLPQLWILSKGYRPKLLLHPSSKSIPSYILDWVKPLGLNEDDFIIPSHISICKNMYVPSRPYMHNVYVSTYAKAVWKSIAGFYAKDARVKKDLKIYVSRANFERRKLVNQVECEQFFENNGFEIIRPEEVPVIEQIKIFARASHVVGPIGAGLHNIVFSQNRNVKLLFLAPHGFPPTYAYKCIEHAFSRNIYTIYGNFILGQKDDETLFNANWQVDMQDVEQGFAQWLKLIRAD